MWKTLGLVFVVLCLLSACDSKQVIDNLEFKHTILLPAELISKDSPTIGYPYDFFVTDSEMYVLCFKGGKWLHSFDMASGREIGSYIDRGRGPGECLMCTKLFFDKTSREVYLFDTDQEMMNVYSIESDGLKFISGKSFAGIESTVFYHVWPMSGDAFLANSQHGSIEDGLTRFQIYSHGDVLLQQNSQIPSLKGDDKYSYTHSSISMSPDRKHLVSVTLMGELLDVYELSADSMKKTVQKMFSAPCVVYQKGVVRETKETKWGFPSVASDNEYIYASLTDDMNPNSYNKIAVFTWEGEGLLRIETDYNVLRIYPHGQDIFAIVANSSNQLFFARLPIKTLTS